MEPSHGSARGRELPSTAGNAGRKASRLQIVAVIDSMGVSVCVHARCSLTARRTLDPVITYVRACQNQGRKLILC